MNVKWTRLAADLLELASGQFSNHGCNDLAFPAGWSAEDRAALLRAMAEDNGTPGEFDPGRSILYDWEVMSFLAGRLRAESGNPAAPDWMIVDAVRRAVGRGTFQVGETTGWLVDHWGELSASARREIAAHLDRCFKEDDFQRDIHLSGVAYPLGRDMDRRDWQRVRRLYRDDGREI